MAEVTWVLRLRWLALAIVPSALLLCVTLHIGTDIVAVPLLWASSELGVTRRSLRTREEHLKRGLRRALQARGLFHGDCW